MSALLVHIEARANAADELLPLEARESQQVVAHEYAAKLRSMADAIDRTHIDDGK